MGQSRLMIARWKTSFDAATADGEERVTGTKAGRAVANALSVNVVYAAGMKVAKITERRERRSGEVGGDEDGGR